MKKMEIYRPSDMRILFRLREFTVEKCLGTLDGPFCVFMDEVEVFNFPFRFKIFDEFW